MVPTIIAFPPLAGGNHLKHLICDSIYPTVQEAEQSAQKSRSCPNFKPLELTELKITCGFFGEILTHRDLIKTITPIKFIILSPETIQDRSVLHQRRSGLGHAKGYYMGLDNYFDGEQVFLYEHFMYHYYLNVPMSDIMNISITDFFKEDIQHELKRISEFCNIKLNTVRCMELHKLWLVENGLYSHGE